MDIFSLRASIYLNTDSYTNSLQSAERSTSTFSANMTTAFSAIKTAGANALGAVAGTIKDVASQSLEYYSQFEQLKGGIETLFKTSADTVENYANEAYKNAGMSANEYMETVTGFAASLIQSTGRGAQQDTEQLKASLDEQYEATKQHLQDVYDAEKDSWDARIASARKYDEFAVTDLKHQKDEALKELKRANEAELDEMKAHNKQTLEDAEAANNSSKTTAQSLQLSAELANQAVIDMSDNANKMGTSMQSIQYAYQGFAKQNYTMLDNLKLGKPCHC